MSNVLRVGLTGNIAAGKSTVAGWLEEVGCTVIDLDALGHGCLARDTPTYERVVELFGEAILDADGSVDRRALAAIVFGNAAARQDLEAILHPAIRALEERRVEEIVAASGSSIVVSEAALLYETGGAGRYHRMVVVTAPDDVRRARLHEKGMDQDEVTRRMRAQMAQEKKAALADYVIENGGSLEAAHQATRSLAGMLRRDLVKHLAGEPLESTPDTDAGSSD
ncbi:MAG: dephospho-CoA kinase [Acidobacteriota bacterium]